MQPIFKFTPPETNSDTERASHLFCQDDFQRYLKINVGKSITATLKLTESIPEKEQLYAFYHKVVLSVAIEMYRNEGWTEMDKVKADYFMKSECGKGIVYNSKTQEEEVYLLDKSKMNKDRLKQFVSDCITFLEVEKGCRVPDSASYLMELRTGVSGFQKLDSKK